MNVEIQDVPFSILQQYVQQQPTASIPEWEQTVLDLKLLKPLVLNGSYARFRTIWALVLDRRVVGYAVTYDPDRSLDMLHLSKAYRGKGLGEWFLRNLNLKEVTVDHRNERALKLYQRLGYEITFA